jgi:hypothetical protein
MLAGPTSGTTVARAVMLAGTCFGELEVDVEGLPLAVDEVLSSLQVLNAGCPSLSVSSWHSPMFGWGLQRQTAQRACGCSVGLGRKECPLVGPVLL